MPHSGWLATSIFVADLLIRIGVSVRVIMRRLPVGVSLAWLAVVLLFPFAGAFVYLYLGEYRLGRKRRGRIAAVEIESRRAASQAAPQLATGFPECSLADTRLPHLVESTFSAALMPGNRLRLLEGADAAFPSLIADIDAARESCDFEFYIWFPGGRVDAVGQALVRAAGRGVRCRLLVDALGSKVFLRRGGAEAMRRQGVAVQAALPSSLLSMPFVRPDLRLHRKIAVIDRTVGYTGSLNMADPLCFKRNAGVGEWVDAMARLEGPAVQALAACFLSTWAVESGTDATPAEWAADVPRAAHAGPSCVQVLPSGPAVRVEAIEQVVLEAIYSARTELVLTTPYFVPNESLLTALLTAANSGVAVTLIVPERVDSRLVHFASRAHQSDLVAAGVHVALYRGGLLHTKSITIDGRASLFGSLNLDPRSMRLNFEITLAIYDAAFTADLKRLQSSYLENSRRLDMATCAARPLRIRLLEDTARLLGPVL